MNRGQKERAIFRKKCHLVRAKFRIFLYLKLFFLLQIIKFFDASLKYSQTFQHPRLLQGICAILAFVMKNYHVVPCRVGVNAQQLLQTPTLMDKRYNSLALIGQEQGVGGYYKLTL